MNKTFWLSLLFIFLVLCLSTFLVFLCVGCFDRVDKPVDPTLPPIDGTPIDSPLKSRDGKFKLDVRTAKDNAQIDWYNSHSDVPAFWNKLGEKELEIFLWSIDEWKTLYTRPEFQITIHIEYGDFHWDILTDTFQQEFIDGKYKDFRIVRAWDERGLLADFGIIPPILNVPYQFHTDWHDIYAIHTTWWSLWFPENDIIFEGDNFVEKYFSFVDDIDRSIYWQSFRESLVAIYADGDVKRDAIFNLVITEDGFSFSVACDVGQSVRVSTYGFIPQPHKSFMVRDKNDFLIFSPGDPNGASIRFN